MKDGLRFVGAIAVKDLKWGKNTQLRILCGGWGDILLRFSVNER